MRGISIVAVALWTAAPWLAAPAMAQPQDLFAQPRLSDDELAELRGGFLTSAGLVSFGIELSGVVANADGVLSSYSLSATLADGALTAQPVVVNTTGDVTAAIQQTGNAFIVSLQAGEGNSFDTIAGSGLFNVIQNNLDNLVISQSTGIEMTLDLDLSAVEASNLAQSLIDAGLLGLQ